MTQISVHGDGQRPLQFIWKGRTFPVLEVVDRWSEFGRWWEGESRCEFYLVFTSIGMHLLCYHQQSGKWYGKPVH